MTSDSKRPPLARWKRIAFSLIPLLLLLVLGEAIIRFYRGRLFSPENARTVRLGLQKHANPVSYDSELGWVASNPPDSQENAYSIRITMTEAGFRDNENTGLALSGAPILVAGDSFTFGAEVNNNESWPSHLERHLRRPVLNAGVGGYGFDQSVLRARREMSNHDVSLLIVSLIPADVSRCQYSVRYSAKPYFAFEDGEFRLRNTPVPRTGLRPAWHKWALGYSYLADWSLSRITPEWWYSNIDKVREHDDGPQIGKHLVAMIAQISQKHSTPAMILLQGSKDTGPKWDKYIEPLRESCIANHIPLLDLYTPIEHKINNEKSLRKKWFVVHHMSDAGNAWVARQAEAFIRERFPEILDHSATK